MRKGPHTAPGVIALDRATIAARRAHRNRQQAATAACGTSTRCLTCTDEVFGKRSAVQGLSGACADRLIEALVEFARGKTADVGDQDAGASSVSMMESRDRRRS